MISKRLTGIESFSSWVIATWSLVLSHNSSYYEKYPALFSQFQPILNENTLVFVAASYFIFTVVLFESQYWKVVSLLHFVLYSGLSYLFLNGDITSQVGYAYGLLAIFNLIRWLSYIQHEKN